MENRDYLYKDISNNEETDIIFENLCFGDIIYLHKDFENMLQDIEVAVELDNRKAFIEGLVKRLNYLGYVVEKNDVDGMLKALKECYKKRIGSSVPKTVKGWVRGTTPGDTKRRNNYELCYALEMSVDETAEFFVKNFMSIPFNYKDSTDAIFFYCLRNKKEYNTVCYFLEKAESFVKSECITEATAEIGRNIAEIDNDEEFIRYLEQHCYNNEQQYQVARKRINVLIDEIKDLLKDNRENRFVNNLVDTVFGFEYQNNIHKNLEVNNSTKKYVMDSKLPKRFVESIPRSGVLGDIIKGKRESYETLRKTLIILYFFSYFYVIENSDENKIRNNALDFYEEIDELLFEVGFSPVYVRHPFDYLMMFCAMSPDPLGTFQEINSYRYVEK